MKILVIEDNNDVRENVEEILELANYEVVSAVDGKSGIKLAKEEIPDLILCDIMMPNIDGYGVLNILSHDPTTSHIPFVFLSAKTEPSEIRKGMNLGADDYITKPFEESDLLNAVETRINRSKLLTDLAKNSINIPYGFENFAEGIEALDNLRVDKKTRQFGKHEIIYQVEDIPRYLYQLNTGKVKIYQVNKEGREITTSLIKPGEYFAYESLMSDQPHFDSAEALEDSEVLLIPKDDFMKLLTVNRDVSAKFIEMLSNNVEEKERKLLDLAYKTVRKRVADALVELYDKYKEDTGNFSIAISRDDLASMVGTSTESAIRMLSEFKSSGLINISGSKITVIEPEKLRKAPY